MTFSSRTMIRVTAALAAALILAPRDARAQLVNGNFSSPGTSGQLTVNTTLTGWTGGGKEGLFGSPSTPPVFVFAPGSTAQLQTTGVAGDAFMGTVKFYAATAPPSGGNVVGADGDPDWAGSISQTVGGLNVGDTYSLSFNWAGAQQQGFTGATTEKWQVSFGSSTQSTPIVNTPSQNFAGWQSSSLTFTPTTASQVLKFLAVGTQGGQPPWLLLNGVQLTDTTVAAVPEVSPLTMSAVLVGLGLAGGLRARLRKAKKVTA